MPSSSRNADRLEQLLKLDDVNKTFSNGTVALQDMSLLVGRHEFLSLLGPSGCGKSTALRLIAGLGGVTAGAIAWSEATSKGDIGFVFQEPTLMPWATVIDNIFLPLKLQGWTKRASLARLTDALSMVGLERFKNSYPRELSGGMKMRVSIARALVTSPKLLLMDEPFAALDEITRFKLNDDLLDLWARQSWTVIFVTHSVYESVYLSNRVAVMAPRPGRVVSETVIDAPYPRDEAFRTSSIYGEYCRHVSGELHRAMDDRTGDG